MPDRRGRPSQVRPRPPSSGRPVAQPVRRQPTRVPRHHPIQRSRGLPFLTRLLLVVAVGALGITVFMTATGGLGRILGAFTSTLTGAIDGLGATPTPRPTVVLVSDSPLITPPEEPYTNQPTIDLVLTIPTDVAGDPESVVRIYLALPDQEAAPILEQPVGATPTLVVPNVELTPGRNDFTASIRGPGGESERSPVVTYVLDTEPPGIGITAPKKDETINRAAATVTGKTQARSALVLRNEANAASVTGTAEPDGTFELVIPIATGTNGLTLTVTDPAGNVNEVVLSVRRGTGKLTAALSSDSYRISRARLPDPLQLAVAVTDPDGRPLTGAQVTFTLSIPGIQVVTSQAETAANGRAVFRTTVPKGAELGEGIATVFVETAEFGRTSDRTIVTIVK